MNKRFIKKFLKKLVKFLIIFGAIGMVLGGIALYLIAVNVDNIDYDSIGLDFSSIIYATDKDGNHVEYEQIYGEQNRLWAALSDMPEHLPAAFVAIEDERFYKHSGFDLKRTVKATMNYVFNRDTSFGGSTINQQLVKNITGDDETSPQRKIVEIFRAIDMDKRLSKDQILELYLNTIYLSQGCHGVETASNKYFGKTVSELTLAECASIAGITQFPTKYDPILNPDNNKAKQELVLAKMLELEMISQDEYDTAMAEELVFQNNETDENASVYSYFTDQIIADVLEDLQKELKLSKSIASKMLFSGGLQIYSTIDKEIQDSIEKVYKNPSDYIRFDEENPIQSAIVIMDPYTGEVKGMSGGLGDKERSRGLNRATESLRQPGSSIKPLSVYAPGFEYKKFTPYTVFVDEPYEKNGHSFKNYYSGFWGAMTVRRAIEQSVNTVAVMCLDKVGIELSYNFLVHNLKLSTITESDKAYSPLALGGLTEGVSVYEMTAAYSAFVNSGIYTEPYTYTKVVDNDGKVILEKKKNSSIAMSEVTARTTVNMLRSVVTNGTGSPAALYNMPVGGKTGTTDDDKDRWFVGITPYYVAAVWVGYDQPKTITGYGTNPAVVLWKNCMKPIHENLPSKAYPEVRGLTEVKICSDSGMLASDLCAQDYRGSRVTTEQIPKSEAPVDTCDMHKKTKVDIKTDMLAGPNCPLEQVEEKVFAYSEDTPVCTEHN